MNSLRKLIDQGIAAIRTTMWGKDVPHSNGKSSYAQMKANEYNNIYGTITNTHAEAYLDGILITGSLINNTVEWNKVLYNRIYLGVDFNTPLIEWININGFKAPVLTIVNNQVACVLEKNNEHNEINR